MLPASDLKRGAFFLGGGGYWWRIIGAFGRTHEPCVPTRLLVAGEGNCWWVGMVIEVGIFVNLGEKALLFSEKLLKIEIYL